jgi:hypothetical protein
MECNRTVNNKYYNNPAIMSDGRAFTDYRSSREVNELIAMRNNVQPSMLYNQFLNHRANQFIDKFRDIVSEKMQMGTVNAPTITSAQTCKVNIDSQVFCEPSNSGQYSIGTTWKATAFQPTISQTPEEFAFPETERS